MNAVSITVILAAIALPGEPQSRKPDASGTQVVSSNWGNSSPRIEHMVDWAFNQPHYSRSQKSGMTALVGRVIFPVSKSAPALVLVVGAQEKPGVVYSGADTYPHLPKYTAVSTD